MKQTPVDIFQAVADSNRRQILTLLSRDKLTINALAENFDMSRPAVSKHIKILAAAGFISIEHAGRVRFCKLNQQGFSEFQEWMNYYDKFWNSKLDALDKFFTKNSKLIKKKTASKKS